MDKRQESIVKMSRSTSAILTSFAAVVTKTPGLSDAHLELDKRLADVEKYLQKQIPEGTNITTVKQHTRDSLEECFRKINSALCAFATLSTDPLIKSLVEKYKYTKSEIEHMKDMTLFSTSYVLYGDALTHVAKLVPYATPEDVEELKDLADDFNIYLPQKRTHIDLRSVATQNIKEAVDGIVGLLKETIDKLVVPWEFKEPDFYKAFKNSRKIPDPPTIKRKPKK